ncbi:DNA-directed RNA polymerase subunit beta' [Ktedonospora formicarum]|uniref:DNA-directed RNA polymerase subunit beta' n=1 Tax=Ktedonospora formicarum TaxID=2778364 RepID=A0A8J3MVV7_9CHLR|nr:DNA-directed RNA polymerase subunit beta' [Ktedonospora formicarum]GHO48043.1 DNA-directed RNA polymerase subunit beta' [Ktedonospora formicarum]
MHPSPSIQGLRISLASPEVIRAWSFGEVREAETLNYRTLKPERDGLFCERIFGPVKSFTCACGKHTKKPRKPGLICDQCGVPLIPASMRRTRMGHIELAVPIVHPWFVQGNPGRLSLLLDLPQQELQDMLYTGAGAEALQPLMAQLDLDALSQDLRHEIAEKKQTRRSRVIKRLKLVESLRASGVRPEWMIMSILPVLPPDLRPVLRMGSGHFASTDINVLYCRVIQRNNRLKHLLEVGAPALALQREKHALQVACDALFDNGHSRQPFVGARKQPLRSLSDTLVGKGGRFRHSLLGKRVDYSGRSVIHVGPDLELHQCGLPHKIALELFKPFLIHKLLAYGLVETHRQARRAIEDRCEEIWALLDAVMRDKVVMLNRAPTLHRLSIQAFEPVLVEGDAIHLHPQVCAAFNADFDGDQMAVHLPLSPEAQAEAREHLLSIHNLLSPASGEPSIAIAQEQVLGCYYLTQERPQKKGEGRVFADEQDAILAYTHGIIDLQAPILVRMTLDTCYDQPPPAAPNVLFQGTRLCTTVGRILFNQALPRALRFRNYAMKKEALHQLLWDCIKICGQEQTASMADAIKRLGFQYATRAAISFSMADIVVPPQKQAILEQADARALALLSEWQEGTMTREELYQRTITLWQGATEDVERQVQGVLDPYGSLATIANSGATKARLQQIRQLSGMRGLMASPSGAILATPVRGNFLEGLTVAEYFLSSHGARKSMMDRALNTAHSGYLTIQLVNAAQNVVVTEEDCGTQESIVISHAESVAMGLPDSSSRLLGRVLAQDVPEAGLLKGHELDEIAIMRLSQAGVTQVSVRSAFTCWSRTGICSKCYGWDLSKRALVCKGVAVGIIAAQSIGEPGTQLTMRTFHSGGIAGGQGDITQGLPRVKELFEVRPPKDPALVSAITGVVSITRDERTKGHIVRVRADHSEESEQGEAQGCYTIPAGRTMLVQHGQHVQAGDPLTAGGCALQDILRYKGRTELALYLLRELQQVYRLTGAYIHDIHFEVIIRQMLQYVRVETSGDTTFLPEDIIDRFVFTDVNALLQAKGGTLATANPVVMGLIPVALATDGWLAAASFQQTTRVLTDAMLEGRVDSLKGMKEHVMLGRMIPAGTGLLPHPVRTAPRKRGRPPKYPQVPTLL